MTQPYVAYAATAGQRDFTVPFPFISRAHVIVRVNGSVTIPFSWPAPSQLRLPFAVTGGAVVEIERVTPIEDQLVKFQDGNILTAEDLNKAVQQILYTQQEVTSLYERSLKNAQVRVGENLGIVTDPAAVSQELAELVLENDVLNEFRQRIADIDLNAVSITTQALTLNNLTGVVDSLLGGDPGTGIATIIQQEKDERIAGDTALANTLALIGAKSGDNLSYILDVNKVRVSPTESLAQRFSALVAQDGTNMAAIQNEQNARVAADVALTTSVNTLGTRLGTAEAAIVNEASARSTAIAAEASARQALAARVGTAEGAITTERNARVTADASIVSDLSLLGAKNGAGTAWLLDMNKVRVDGTTTLGTRLSGIDAALGANSAAVVNEQTARVSADNALAQSISTLSTTLNGNTASVSTLQSTVNGLQARYGVSLDVNGYVTGFLQNNDGRTGSFTIVADKFAIVTPGSSPQVPFEVSGGVVRIKEAAIGNLTIGKLSDGRLDADMTVGSGRIIWDNGIFMKVSGVGFGTQGQFIEWFGPRIDIDLCSEANAVTFLKTNGDAYFGGSLNAGTVVNAVQTTTVGADAVLLGPFTAFGRAASTIVGGSSTIILDTASQTWPRTEPPADPYVNSRQNFAVSYVLERATNENGPWTQVATYNGTGTSSTSIINAGTSGGSEPIPMRRYQHSVSLAVSATTALTLPAGAGVLRMRRTSLVNTTTGQAAAPNSLNNINIRYTEP